MAVAQALPGIRSEARWLRFLPKHPPAAFPYLPGRSGYNKHMRATAAPENDPGQRTNGHPSAS
jgi:hypothetical protein